MELLTAVNRILPVLGEHPVTALDTKHPTLAIMLPKIALKIDDVLQPGWWFNEYDTKYYPDSEGFIALPSSTLSFIPDTVPAIVRGQRLFNPTVQDYVWTEPVEGRIIERLAFNELPESAATAVMYAVMVASYVTDIGLESDVQLWQREQQAAEMRMQSEHLKYKRYSTATGRRFQRIRRAMVN